MKDKIKQIFGIKFTVRHIVMIVIACVINAGLFLAMYFTGMPLVLDNVGTAYISYLLGPTAGIIAAIINFFLQFSFYRMSAFVNLAISLSIALIVGVSSRKKDYKNFLAVLGTAFLSYILAALFSSLMPVLNINMDNNQMHINLIYTELLSFISEDRLSMTVEFTAALMASALMKLIDCLATTVLAVVVYYLTPKKFRNEMLEHHLEEGDNEH